MGGSLYDKSADPKNRAGTRPAANGYGMDRRRPVQTPDYDRKHLGDSHPGSAHLLELVEQTASGVNGSGGKAARYFATDICDGMAQGHDGINYSLASQDTIANLIEIHAGATPFDGGVFLSSCDKAVPAH